VSSTYPDAADAPTAFVSYAHEDSEFVLALIDRLHGEGLGVRYDRLVLLVGDSLLARLADAIADDDFLIAVISPDSVESPWCQKEISIAMHDGINNKRVKVLPVKFGDPPEIPPMLGDILYTDADRYDLDTVAKELATSMRGHADRREAELQARATGEVTINADTRSAVLAQIDVVAQLIWPVLNSWERLWRGSGNIFDIAQPQRPLKWELDKLPEEVRVGLPSVVEFAEAGVDYFATDRTEEVEAALDEEMRSVRRQVEQGLPVTRRWTLGRDLGPVLVNRDAKSNLWEINRGDEVRTIQFYVSGTVLASDDGGLPPEVAEAKQTNGRSAVMSVLAMEDPPKDIVASSTGISFKLPD
jgi:TIR domain